MDHLVAHLCPKHGDFGVAARPMAVVYHRCGEMCAPEGVTPAEHWRAYRRRSTQRKLMRARRVVANNATPTPATTAKSELNEAPRKEAQA